MGVTTQNIKLIERVLKTQTIKSVCELGAQYDYRDEHIRRSGSNASFTYPYFADYWKNHAMKYICIDLNGENDALEWDLAEPVKTNLQFDLVTDFGTCEHISDIYQCFLNIHNLTKVGGTIIHINPKSDNWPVHGYHFFSIKYWNDFAKAADYEVLAIGEEAAMQNVTDGWEVYVILRKVRDEFIDEIEMPKPHTK